MTAEVSRGQKYGLLVKALRADGVFAAASGLVSILGARAIADLFALDTTWILLVLGVVLLGYAAVLLLGAPAPDRNRQVAGLAVVLNLVWVVGSYAGLLLDWFPVNGTGKWAIAVVAEIVFIFAALEFYALRKTQRPA